MDLLGEDFLTLLKAFEQNHLKYIIVGGFATNFHGHHRATGDIDFWIQDTIENRKNLIDSLDSIGYGRIEELMQAPLIAGYCEIMLDHGMYADFMNSILGFDELDFETCFERAEITKLEGTLIRFLQFNDLLRSKLNSERPKDMLDAIELKRIKDELDKEDENNGG